jgi:hypothetical protein
MADIVTGTVTGLVDQTALYAELANIRHEESDDSSAVKESVKEAGWKTLDRVTQATDRITDQSTAYFVAGQNINFSNATALASLKASTDANFVGTQAAIALEAAKNATATALGQSTILQAIVADGNNTRALINSQTIDELRNKLLHQECQGHRGHREGTFEFAAPVSARVPM